ncbi:MAG: tetratricopeptide repeat protein, partial [Verrucomicrobiota bacterium]
KRQLAEFALQQIGIYLSGTDNPFLAVPYFEELLSRSNPEADAFKAEADMALGEIEARSPDPVKVQSARERFRRVIDKYESRALTPQAYLNLANLHIKQEEWKDALAALDAINKNKSYFGDNRAKRAEALYLLGTVLDELDDPSEANQAYLGVVTTYPRYHDWVTQAWEKYIPNSLEFINALPEGAEEERWEKRKKQIALYRLCVRYIYQWQNLDEEADAPSGALRRLRRQLPELKADLAITPEEDLAVKTALGITEE